MHFGKAFRGHLVLKDKRMFNAIFFITLSVTFYRRFCLTFLSIFL
jgi:hypothetical protein